MLHCLILPFFSAIHFLLVYSIVKQTTYKNENVKLSFSHWRSDSRLNATNPIDSTILVYRLDSHSFFAIDRQHTHTHKHNRQFFKLILPDVVPILYTSISPIDRAPIFIAIVIKFFHTHKCCYDPTCFDVHLFPI